MRSSPSGSWRITPSRPSSPAFPRCSAAPAAPPYPWPSAPQGRAAPRTPVLAGEPGPAPPRPLPRSPRPPRWKPLRGGRPALGDLRVTGVLRLMGSALEIDELRELGQHPDIHPIRMRHSHLPPAVGDADHAALRAGEQASLIHVGDGPVQPVGEQRRSAGDRGPQVILAQGKPIGYDSTKLSQRVVAAICEDAQSRRHQRLVVRYWHRSSLPADGCACPALRTSALVPAALAARIVGVQIGSSWTNVLERSRLNAVV